MKTKLWALTSLLFIAAPAWGAFDQTYFQKFQSPFVEILSPSSMYFKEATQGYPLVGWLFKKEFWKWDATWPKEYVSPQCDPKLAKGDIPAYLRRCEHQLQSGINSSIPNIIGTVSLKLDPYKHPYLQPVLLHLPGVELRGLLALKGDFKKRPFIILRTGIFANAQDLYPERFLFLSYFEQTAFNVLLLESVSSFEYAARNRNLLMGGYDEGLQNFFIASRLQDQDEPLNQLVDSVHMVAISHGGAGLLYSAMLNDLNAAQSSDRKIASFQAYCPLVDLPKTLTKFAEDRLFTLANAFLSANRIQKVKEYYPNLSMWNFIETLQNVFTEQYPKSKFEIPKEWKLPSVGQAPPDRPKGEFWKLNNFSDHIKEIESPLLIFATKHDPMVKLELNTGWIQENVHKANIQTHIFQEGHHCSFPVAYNTTVVAGLAHQEILQHSAAANFSEKQVSFSVPSTFLEEQKRWPGETPFLKTIFEVEDSHMVATVTWQRGPFLPWLQQWLAPSEKFIIPISEFVEEWGGLETTIVETSTRSMIRRWSQANIQVKIEQENIVFHWASYQ